MNDTKQFVIEATCPSDYSDEHKRHIWENTKREAGLKLYSILEQQKNPVVVELFEDIKIYPIQEHLKWSPLVRDFIGYSETFGKDKLRIAIRLTEVQYRDVEYAVNYSQFDYLKNYKPSLYNKIKWNIVKPLIRKFRTLKINGQFPREP